MKRLAYQSLFMLLFSSTALADESASSILLRVPTNIKPVDAVIVPTDKSVKQTPMSHRPLALVKDGSPGQSVKVTLQPEDSNSELLLTVIGEIPGGELYATPLTQIRENVPPPVVLASSCKSTKDSSQLVELPEDSLRRLVEIREKKKEVLLEKLKGELTPALYATFRQSERELGLSYPNPFDETLDADELVQRMLLVVSLSERAE